VARLRSPGLRKRHSPVDVSGAWSRRSTSWKASNRSFPAIQGAQEKSTYEEVSSGTTGHAEAIEVTYDPAAISYSSLLDVFWRNIDPTVKDRQFCDVGRNTAQQSGIIMKSRGASLKNQGKHWSSQDG